MTDSDHSTDIVEHNIRLTEYDLDHLNDGQPVFKGVNENLRIVLRPEYVEE
jgi:hypothetical protein